MNTKYIEIVESQEYSVVDRDSLLVGLMYYPVKHPAFFDHSMTSRAVTTQKMTLEEFKKVCKANKAVYVYQVLPDPSPNTCMFRFVALAQKPITQLVDEVVLGKRYFEPDTFKTVMGVTMKIDTDALQDLAAHWGKEEAALQLGQQILDTICVSKCDGPCGHDS
jgi:hypothetical protein